jgi:phosphonate transport system ATP-binding protein
VTQGGNGALALHADGVSFSYRNHEVLTDVSLAVPVGRHTVIMGPSGAGKTTLLRILAGILVPARGRVTVLNEPIEGRSPRELSSFVGYIPQQLGLVRSLSALDNVLMGALGRLGNVRAVMGLFPSQEVGRAEAALDLMGIAHKRLESVVRLSGGERQRVAIARTLLQRPRVVIADEFASDLDLEMAWEILGRIRSAADQQQITFVMSMHRHGLARHFGDEVLKLEHGRLVPGLLGPDFPEMPGTELNA